MDNKTLLIAALSILLIALAFTLFDKSTEENTILVQVPCSDTTTSVHIIDTLIGVNAEVTVTPVKANNPSYNINIVSIRTSKGLKYFKVEHDGSMRQIE